MRKLLFVVFFLAVFVLASLLIKTQWSLISGYGLDGSYHDQEGHHVRYIHWPSRFTKK
jgi:hypothetical protein